VGVGVCGVDGWGCGDGCGWVGVVVYVCWWGLVGCVGVCGGGLGEGGCVCVMSG